MKLAFLITGFYKGGFINSLNNLISNLDKDIIIDIYTFGDVGDTNLIPEGVNVKKLQHKDTFLNKLMLKISLSITTNYLFIKTENQNSIVLKQIYYDKYVKYCMKKVNFELYDAVISWEEIQCNYFLAYKVKANKKIAYIHPDYVLVGYSSTIDSKMLKNVNYLVGVSKNNCMQLEKIFKSIKIRHIPNTLNVNDIDVKSDKLISQMNENIFKIITVCRLENKSKALDRLVNITKRLNEKGYEFNWYIVGEGEDRKLVEDLCLKNKINNIYLLGNKNNPFPYIKKADLFVLQSYYEGKPLVIDEAQYLNTPVLVTNYISAKEQVDINCGYIVDNKEDSIYNMLEHIFNNKSELLKKKNELLKQDKSNYTNISSFMSLIND